MFAAPGGKVGATPQGKNPGRLRRIERQIRPYLQTARWRLTEPFLAWAHPDALKLYRQVMASAYLPDDLIDVAPELRILYVAVPKAASSRVRSNLAAMIGRDTISAWRSDANWKVHSRKASHLRAPRHGVVDFHRMATDPSALRFTFVRNPYARLVSCWADQYRDMPLGAHPGRTATYLAHREKVSDKLPVEPGATLSFADFVRFACASATWRIDRHWQMQSDIIDLPGIGLDLIGKAENFAADFVRVLDHVGAGDTLRQKATASRLHASAHGGVSTYFTAELADLVYRSYERDFDRLHYSRALPE